MKRLSCVRVTRQHLPNVNRSNRIQHFRHISKQCNYIDLTSLLKTIYYMSYFFCCYATYSFGKINQNEI